MLHKQEVLRHRPVSGYPLLSTNKNIPVFRIIRPYLNLLVKPRIFSGFLERSIISCILKAYFFYKMHKIIFFPEKSYVFLHKLKFLDPFSATLIYIFGLSFRFYFTKMTSVDFYRLLSNLVKGLLWEINMGVSPR